VLPAEVVVHSSKFAARSPSLHVRPFVANEAVRQ